jgi:predicted Zn-dependent peptidase
MTKKLSLNKTAKVWKPTVLTIHNYKIVLIKDTSKLLSVHSYIFSGFIRETAADLGINHLLEHVLANAYAECKSYNCYSYREQYGFTSNASTSNNILHYYVNGMYSDWDVMINYIVSISTKPEFNEALITREKAAVKNELHVYKDNSKYPILLARDRLLYKIYGLQNMSDAKQQLSNLKHFNKAKLLRYYKKTYNHKNTIFVISGNFSKQKVVTLLKGLLPNKVVFPINNTLNTECFTHKPHTAFLYNPKLTSTQIAISYPVDITYNDSAIFGLDFTITVLRQQLFQRLRTEKKLVYGIELTLIKDVCGAYIHLFINTINDNVQKVLDEYHKVIYDYVLPSVKRINAVKKLYQNKYNSTLFTATSLGPFFGIQYIYKYLLNTDVWMPHDILALLLSTTSKQVQQNVQQYFDQQQMICIISNNKKRFRLDG